MKPSRLAFSCTLLLVFFNTVMMFGQTQGTWLPPFGSFQGGGFDTVNFQSLNVNFIVPIVSHPGRGIGFQYGLGYNTLIWSHSSSGWKPAANWGWVTGGPVGYLSFLKTTFPCI